jgi:hypothetical protein
MTLIDDWKDILQKAWSVKCNIAATLLGAAEVVVSMVQPAGIPSGLFAGLAAVVSILANVARVTAQAELQKDLQNGPATTK